MKKHYHAEFKGLCVRAGDPGIELMVPATSEKPVAVIESDIEHGRNAHFYDESALLRMIDQKRHLSKEDFACFNNALSSLHEALANKTDLGKPLSTARNFYELHLDYKTPNSPITGGEMGTSMHIPQPEKPRRNWSKLFRPA